MDKELNSIADDIIKDSFGSSAPSEVPGQAPSPAAPPTTAPSQVANQPQQRPLNTLTASRDPFAAQRPATPRETFTAEVPTAEPRQAARPIPTPRAAQSMPTMPPQNLQNPQKANEYSRIKEQMSAAREASSLPDPSAVPAATNMPKRGLNKVILLFIILIPVIVVVAGVVIALLNQPTTTTTTTTSSEPQYVDPRKAATKIDLSTYESEIQLSEAGHYILTGTTTFPIKVDAPGEVTLYLDNITVTATDASAISNFSENHLVLVLDDGTESTLAVTDPETFTSIYSAGDLTIDGGTGILNVSGIKIADGKHYDVTGNGINDTKGVVVEPKSEEPAAEGTTPETTTPAENSEVAQPAEGESAFQEGTEPPAEPATEGPTSTEAQPAEN